MTDDTEQADEADQTDDLPEIDDDKRVDVDLDAVDDAIDEEDDEEKTDDTADHTDETSQTTTSRERERERTPSSTAGYNWGDQYVRGLSTMANAAIDRYSDDGEHVDPAMARDLELDRAFNDWLNEHSMQEDMDPGQAVLVGTLLFLVTVVALNSDVASGLMADLEGVVA